MSETMNITWVFVYYTGGTIGMIPGPDGKPQPAGFRNFTTEMRKHPQLFEKNDNNWFYMPKITLPGKGPITVAYKVEEVEKPIDSTNLDPSSWSKFEKMIIEKDKEGLYNGYVIIHGTDTLAYTSSALSFMLHGRIKKPVILTGSQKSLFDPRTDAVGNLQGSMILAGCYGNKPQLQQVTLFFNYKLFQGNRASKFNADDYEAFTSPKYPPLAEIGVDIKVNDLLTPVLSNNTFPNVIIKGSDARLIYLFPGIQKSFITSALADARGVVLASFGAGNVPDHRWLRDALGKATSRNVSIINCSQLFKGKVLPIYDVSKWLVTAGVVSGYDITPEAALTKLIWALQLPNKTYTQRQQILGQNICGEMTIPSPGAE